MPPGANGAAASRAARGQDPSADQAARPGRIQLSATSDSPIAAGGRVAARSQQAATSSTARRAPSQLSSSGGAGLDTGEAGARPIVTTSAEALATVADPAARTPGQAWTDRVAIGRRSADRSSAMIAE